VVVSIVLLSTAGDFQSGEAVFPTFTNQTGMRHMHTPYGGDVHPFKDVLKLQATHGAIPLPPSLTNFVLVMGFPAHLLDRRTRCAPQALYRHAGD
jgi:hypothetical protein